VSHRSDMQPFSYL